MEMMISGSTPVAIQKAMGHKDIKTTMIYVDVAKPHIREQVEKLDRIMVPPSPQRIKALPL
jgi:site-specific recombinase XerD